MSAKRFEITREKENGTVWKKHLRRLAQRYPEAFKLFQPASAEQIASTEHSLGLRLGDLDPDWPEFLQFTNGAAVLDYWFLRATPGRRKRDLASANTALWHLECYRWLKEHFVAFLEMMGPSTIGFVREGSGARCVAYLSEPTETFALPIASSFGCFLNGLLHDAEAALREAARTPGGEPAEYMADT